jgi:hypothetical protein
MARMEATEMQEFSEKMKEGGDASLTSISLAISILAVLVAMVTVLGHRAHTEAVLLQSRSGDEWTLYDAKKSREDTLSLDLDMLQLQPRMDTQTTEAKLAEYRARLAKWNVELAQEEDEAHALEREVKLAETRAGHFDLGEALLQISVVLSSITLFTRRRSYFVGGLALGIAGVVVAASAWLVR